MGFAGSASVVGSAKGCGFAHGVRKLQESPTTSPNSSAWPLRPHTVVNSSQEHAPGFC